MSILTASAATFAAAVLAALTAATFLKAAARSHRNRLARDLVPQIEHQLRHAAATQINGGER